MRLKRVLPVVALASAISLQFLSLQVFSLYAQDTRHVTEPALRPIRNMLPNLGGIDISPVILILLIILIERVIVYYIYPNVV